VATTEQHAHPPDCYRIFTARVGLSPILKLKSVIRNQGIAIGMSGPRKSQKTPDPDSSFPGEKSTWTYDEC
jgi:hypothetical protein